MEQPEEGDDGLTAEGRNKIESMMMEVHFAAPELDEFLKWVATNTDFEDEELTVVISAVYSYARNKNDVDAEEEEGGSSEPDQS